MTDEPQQPGAPTGTLDAAPLSAASLSGGDAVRYHAVSDKDIAKLKRMEMPTALLVAGLFGGLFFAGTYHVHQLFMAVGTGEATLLPMDLGFVAGWAASFGIALTAAFASARRRTRVMLALDQIRSRPYLPVAARDAPSGAAPHKARRFLGRGRA